jgi:hypothetical protein
MRKVKNKWPFVKAVNDEAARLQRIIDQLQEGRDRLKRFGSMMEGKDGLARCDAEYDQNEDEIAEYLPYKVLRIFNPHV